MSSLKLKIPVRDSRSSANVNPNVDYIRRLLEGLPLANPAECCVKITHLVHQLNRAPIDVKIRIKIMTLILPLFDDIVTSLRAGYLNASLPLSDRRQEKALAARRLMVEMSHAYKIIVMDITEGRAAGNGFLPQAIYYALGCLSRLLLDSYALYAPEPRQTWLEINQLYLYAEKNGFESRLMDPINVEQEPRPATIVNTFKRIILLALANPYHLMQGEAVKMFGLLKHWCTEIEILPLPQARLPEGKLFIDLAVDAPPMYAPKVQNELRAIEPRLLEIKGLMSCLDNEIRRLAIESKGSGRQSNLGRRMERDMYFRWSEAWGLRRERMSHRKPRKAPARMLCGLTAAHYYIGGCKPFTPEEDEMRLRGIRHEGGGAGSSLSLVPEEHQPWLQTDEQPAQRILPKHRTSQFDSLSNTSEKDMWIKVFTTSDAALFDDYRDDPAMEERPKACEIRNANQGGFGLYCPRESGFPARVGELVATQSEENPDLWAIGSARWMKLHDNKGFEMGVKLISEDACAVATKAVLGVGKGSEYYRGLLLPDMDPVEFPTTLITPAAVYDVGTVVILLTPKRLVHAKLIRQLESTSSFSHYQFELVPPPPEETRRRAEEHDEPLAISRTLFQ